MQQSIRKRIRISKSAESDVCNTENYISLLQSVENFAGIVACLGFEKLSVFSCQGAGKQVAQREASLCRMVTRVDLSRFEAIDVFFFSSDKRKRKGMGRYFERMNKDQTMKGVICKLWSFYRLCTGNRERYSLKKYAKLSTHVF